MGFSSGLLVYCIGAFKCYLDISDLGSVVSKGNPSFAFVVEFVGLGFILCF
jgi:hypothetical protein